MFKIKNLIKKFHFRSESLLPAESFIAILQEALSDHSFVIDYQKVYPIENDVEILKQACKELYVYCIPIFH